MRLDQSPKSAERVCQSPEFDGAGFVVVYVNNFAPRLTIHEPITVSFEPIPLEEDHPGLRNLMTTVTARGIAPSPLAPPSRIAKFLMRYMFPYGLLAFWTIRGVLQIMQEGVRSGISLMYLGGLVAVLLFFLFHRLIRLKEWFLLPGGVAVRQGRLFSKNSSVQLFSNRDSVLVVKFEESRWMPTLVSEEGEAKCQLSLYECEALVACWQSPVAVVDSRMITGLLG